jgi:RNA polymerase sigma factor (sigma-70 family)
MAHTSVSPIARMIGRLTEDQRNKHLPDKDLLLRFSGGQDQAAFAGLLRRHGTMVLDVCRSVAGNEADAEDAFQATFLVLARSAKAIRKLASVGSWLHGVAYRTALNGRKEFARRRKLESCAPRPTDLASAQDLPWSEVQELLHAELTALSERYRAPLVLCFLEGRTQDEAAKQLNISKSTLRKRLERGRSILRVRLVRHGLGTAAVLTAAAWPSAKASACVSPTLVASTVKAATALAGGQPLVGLVSGHVSYLVANALKVTLATKLKIATAVVLALALVPALMGVVFTARSPMKSRQVADRTRSTQKNDNRTSLQTPPTDGKLEPADDEDIIAYGGKVLAPDGRGVAGAKIYVNPLGGGYHWQPNLRPAKCDYRT